MTRHTGLKILLGLLLSSTSAFAQGAWETLADMPTARSGLAAGVIDGKLYVVGGRAGSRQLKSAELYDPVTNRWTALRDMPTARANLAAGVINRKLYIVGGYGNSGIVKKLERYNPVTDRWTTLPDMPTPLSYPAAWVIGGKLYVVGGYDGSRNVKTLERYDPTTDRWSTLASMPTARSNPAAGVIDRKLYVVGGNDNSKFHTTLERYDPATDWWTTLPDMPTPRSYLAAGVIDGKLHVVGGYYNSRYVKKMEVYDPATDRWTTLPDMPTPRSKLAAGVIDGTLYVVGGYDGSRRLKTLERYHPTLVRLTYHQNDEKRYYSRFVAANWDSISDSNGYLWQINQSPTHSPQLPPLGEDWWTISPRLSWVVPEAGVWYLHHAIIDIDGIVGGVEHQKITVITDPPEVNCTTHPDPTLQYPFPNVSLKWEQVGIDSVYALIDNRPVTMPNRSNSRPFTGARIRFRNQPSGTHFVHIRGADDAGTMGPTVHMQINIGRESTPAPPGAERVTITDIMGPVGLTQSSNTATASGVARIIEPLAVLDFERQGVDENTSIMLTARLRDAIVQTGVADVYERSQMEEILKEQGFQQSECTQTSCAVEIGRLVNVERIIVGEVGRLGAAYLISARVIDVETGKVIRTAASPATSSPEALLRYLPSMAWTLLSNI